MLASSACVLNLSHGELASLVRMLKPDLNEESNSNEQDSGHGALVVERVPHVERPKLYKVYLLNDDYTPMDFVVDILINFFGKSSHEATDVMLKVHHEGKGLCGVYPYEIAETKVALVSEKAREEEYPLQCSIERE